MKPGFLGVMKMQVNMDPVADNPDKPAMGEPSSKRQRAASRKVEMPDKPASDKGGRNRMPTSSASKGRQKGPNTMSDSRRPSAKQAGEGPTESYLRMQVRVQDGVMSLVSVREVDGPLIQSATLGGQYVYEVIRDGRSLAVGDIADLGERRSFPSPTPATEAMTGHHIAPMATVEFAVRVPKTTITTRSLGRTDIVLYRVKETPAKGRALAQDPLDRQFARELREVARLSGIRMNDLPSAVQRDLRAILP